MSNYTHIRIEAILQPVNSDFDANMQEAERQKKLAEAAPALLRLARRVSRLNPTCPEIGAGMLASLVNEAFQAIHEVEAKA